MVQTLLLLLLPPLLLPPPVLLLLHLTLRSPCLVPWPTD
jgi:hypothetical protein